MPVNNSHKRAAAAGAGYGVFFPSLAPDALTSASERTAVAGSYIYSDQNSNPTTKHDRYLSLDFRSLLVRGGKP
jgi:hypothetical protein